MLSNLSPCSSGISLTIVKPAASGDVDNIALGSIRIVLSISLSIK
jgi:hypothetical protein